MIQENYILICVKLFYGNAIACRGIKYMKYEICIIFFKAAYNAYPIYQQPRMQYWAK